jgi:hypothetical protein
MALFDPEVVNMRERLPLSVFGVMQQGACSGLRVGNMLCTKRMQTMRAQYFSELALTKCSVKLKMGTHTQGKSQSGIGLRQILLKARRDVTGVNHLARRDTR